MKGRWIRLDTTWSLSPWLVDLPPESRLVWIELLCYCKSDGIGGRVKAVGASAFATRRNVTRNAVTVTLDAAHADEAMRTEEGEWVFTGWDKYQSNSDAADRQRRYRQRKKGLTESDDGEDKLSALRNARNVTRDVTQSNGTETETGVSKEPPIGPPSGEKRKSPARPLPADWEPKDSHRKKAEELGLDLPVEVEAWRDHHLARDNRFVDWDLTFHTWLRNTQKYGPNGGPRKKPPDSGMPMGRLRDQLEVMDL